MRERRAAREPRVGAGHPASRPGAAGLHGRFTPPVTEVGMTSDDERDLRQLLERLKQEHRDLDSAIDALTAVSGSDVLQVQRLKKRKLQLKDRLRQVEDQLFPDIIA